MGFVVLGFVTLRHKSRLKNALSSAFFNHPSILRSLNWNDNPEKPCYNRASLFDFNRHQPLKGGLLTNIYDISKLAGVSIATVSRVLNGSDKVSETTRQKVLDVMEQNGYTPNAFARGLGLNTMRTVGILCADSSDIYLARVIYWLERELWKNSYASMLCCTGYKLEEKEKYLQLLLSRNVDALILAGSQFIEEKDEDNAYLYDAAKKVPVFLLNGVLAGSGAYSVVCDDALAVKEMTDELLELGCKRPIFLYRSLSYSGKQKLSGFCRALSEHALKEHASQEYALADIPSGHETPEERSFLCPAGIPETAQFLRDLEARGVSFDACLSTDDELAAGAVKYALNAGKRIPEDIQITGYNNSLLSICSTPEITTADNRVESLCTTAVSLLMQVLEGKDVPERTMYSANLIRRATTKSRK